MLPDGIRALRLVKRASQIRKLRHVFTGATDVGIVDIGQPRPKQTVVVSIAVGATGSLVG
jgi:NADPH-dependent curcumin reductase CurA